MRVYIAGPMTGYPDHNYPAFIEAAATLRTAGHDVVAPHELHDDDLTRPFDWYLRRDLTALLTCEAVALLPGAQNSRGAILERNTAEALDMPVYLYRDRTLVPA